jgi:cyclic dehypoxanthinyl futalosine synthase
MNRSVESRLPGAGRRLSPADALRLLHDEDWHSLGEAACQFRRRLHPNSVVTYVADRNVNYSNVCEIGCRFCAFHRHADAADAYLLSREALHAKLRELSAAGGTQVMLQGGCRSDLPLSWYEELLGDIKREFPRLHVHAFSPPEIVCLSKAGGLSVLETLRRLKTAGLDSIPGGGAEILCDRVRREVSPRKATTAEWLDVFRRAATIGLNGSATMVCGLGETDEECAAHWERLRNLQDETSGNGQSGVFVSFTLWPLQAARTSLEGVFPRVDAVRYLRLLAVARLFLDNIPHLQAGWVTMGVGVGQLSLLYGADDWGGLMMEENVVRAAGCEHRTGTEELRRLSADIGLVLRKRDFFYNDLGE